MSSESTRERPRAVPPRLGRYEIVAPIASGGMASVHLARRVGQAGLSRAMALKLLHPHLLEDSEFVSMFLDEARIAARIRHGNVVDVYDVETIDGEMVIVMEYVEGASLQALYRAASATKEMLPRGFLLRVVRDMLRGLHAAHEVTDDAGEPVGLVHRDVSPHNVLVGVDGVSRVTDFGIAKARGRSTATRTGMVKGKLQYLAPEQLRGLPIDRRVDVFAAGIVLWEALTGRALFRADHEAETMMHVLQKAIPPPSTLASGVTLAMDRVCLRALERNPDKRFPTAAEFADALEDASAGELFRAKEVGEIVERWVGASLEPLRRALRAPVDPSKGEPPPRATVEVATIELPTEAVRVATGTPEAADATHTRLRASLSDAATEVMEPKAAAESAPPKERPARTWLVAAASLLVGAAGVYAVSAATSGSSSNEAQPAPSAPPAPLPSAREAPAPAASGREREVAEPAGRHSEAEHRSDAEPRASGTAAVMPPASSQPPRAVQAGPVAPPPRGTRPSSRPGLAPKANGTAKGTPFMPPDI